MNRREFFRRAVPATAVTVAAFQGNWAMDFFRRILGRVLRAVEETSFDSEAQILRQFQYQARMAMQAMSNSIAAYVYGGGRGILASVGDEPRRLMARA